MGLYTVLELNRIFGFPCFYTCIIFMCVDTCITYPNQIGMQPGKLCFVHLDIYDYDFKIF